MKPFNAVAISRQIGEKLGIMPSSRVLAWPSGSAARLPLWLTADGKADIGAIMTALEGPPPPSPVHNPFRRTVYPSAPYRAPRSFWSEWRNHMVNLLLEAELGPHEPGESPERSAPVPKPNPHAAAPIVPLPLDCRPSRHMTPEERSIWAPDPAPLPPPKYRVPKDIEDAKVCQNLRHAMADEAHNVLVREGRKAVSFSIKQPNGGRIFLTATYVGPGTSQGD